MYDAQQAAQKAKQLSSTQQTSLSRCANSGSSGETIVIIESTNDAALDNSDKSAKETESQLINGIKVFVLSNQSGQRIATLNPITLTQENLADKTIKEVIAEINSKQISQQSLNDNQLPQLTLSSKLTCREHEILHLIGKGLSNKLIARELNISDGTVKVHVKHLLKKLKLKSRVEAAVWIVNNQVK